MTNVYSMVERRAQQIAGEKAKRDNLRKQQALADSYRKPQPTEAELREKRVLEALNDE